MYTISKLLLNSLYGRFGMNPKDECHEIINVEKTDLYLLNDELIVKDVENLNNGKALISYFNKKELKVLEDGSKKMHYLIIINL
jgi:hypothetical protein